jgi:hypothetical protein
MVDFGNRELFKYRAVPGDPGRAAFNLAGSGFETGQKEGQTLEDGKNSYAGGYEIDGHIVQLSWFVIPTNRRFYAVRQEKIGHYLHNI